MMHIYFHGKRLRALLAASSTAVAIACVAPAGYAQTHTFNLATGQNKNGVLKNAGPDANWVVTAWQQRGTNFKLPLKASIVSPGDADWYSEWVQDFNTYPSRWIAPDPSCSTCNGDYTITYKFNLARYNLATASFSNLYWAIDDSGYIQLNGNTVATTANFTSMTSFTIPVSDLVQGENKLTITSVNSDYLYEGARLEGTLTIAPSAPNFTTLYSFTGGADGSAPTGGLIEDSAGLIYGTAYSGGDNKYGTIYSFNPTSKALTPLYAFDDGIDGAQPRDRLTPQINGSLVYGTTQYGGSANAGVVYQFNTSNNELTTLYSFQNGTDGAAPGGNLQIDAAGNLDGEVSAGGGYNFGGVFQVNPTNETEKVLYSFPGGKNGSKPGLITLNAAGVIYGTTGEGGGANNAGTIYSLNPSTGKKAILYTFQDGADGASPNGGLASDSSGDLYGTARDGGANSEGTLFKYNVNTKQFTTLYAFTGKADGSVPLGGLVLDDEGVLWGVTEKTDGKGGTGTLYSFNTETNTFTTEHSFTGGADGGTPNQFLLLGSDGALYGTTVVGGTAGFGTVYKYAP